MKCSNLFLRFNYKVNGQTLIVSIFKKTRLNWIAYLFLYFLALKSVWFFIYWKKQPQVLENSFLNSFLPLPLAGYISVLAAGGLVFLAALLVNGIANRHGIYGKPSGLGAMTVLLLSSLAAPLQGIGLFTGLFLLSVLIFNKLFKAYTKETIEYNAFDISFLTGLGSLFFPPFAALFIAFLLCISVISIPRVRYFGIAAFAFTLPYYGWAIVKFLSNDLQWFVSWWQQWKQAFLNVPQSFQLLKEAALITFLCIALLTILYYFIRKRRIPAGKRPLLISCILCSFVLFVTTTLFPSHRLSIFSLFVLPVSIGLSHIFYFLPSTLARLLHILILVIAISLPLITF